MPIKTTKSYVQFGKTGKKYYFINGNKESERKAREKAISQGRAIEISKRNKKK